MRKILGAIILLLVVPSLVFGQAQTTGRVSGQVVDKDGNPVANAKITLISPALQGERVFSSDVTGKFLATLLPSGPYSIAVSAPKMGTTTISFRVGVGETIPIEVTMQSGEGIVEEVTVYGNLSKLATTAGGENFRYDERIDELPVRDRDIEEVATLAPNVSFGPTPGTLAISGAPSFDTTVLLDGSEVSDPYYGSASPLFLEDAIEEVQVLTSGVSARYGRFQGGVINATTKSGGNTFDGTVRATFDKEEWNSASPYGEAQSDNLNKTYQATLGGYILKDRLWFFVGGRTIPTEEASGETHETLQSYVTTRDEDRYQVKLRGAFTPNHVVEAGYLNFDANAANRAGLPPADLLAATGVREDPRETYTLTYQGVLSSKLFLDVKATKKDLSIASGGDPALGSPFLENLDGPPFYQVMHNHWWDFTDPSVRDNDTMSASLTQVLTTGDWGDHTLEYGVQYVKSTTGGENRQSSTGFNLTNYDYDAFYGEDEANPVFSNFDDVNNPRFALYSYYTALFQPGFTYRWVALPLGGGQEVENTALFVQDSWQKGKWRVDAGVRWESYDAKGPEPTLDLNFNDFSPRLGLTYNIDQNWQVQATWGKYVSRFNDNVASSVSGVGGAPYVISLYTGDDASDLTYDDVEAILRDDANWELPVVVTDPKQPTRFLAENAQAPYANDFNFSVKRALPRNTGSLVFTYSNRNFEDLLDDEVGDFGVTTVTDPIGGVDTFDFDTVIWGNSGEARRDYQALTATFDYRPSARWSVGGNYTYSLTRGNYEGEARNQPSSGSIIGNYPRSVITDSAYPYGYLASDIRHRARVWGSYRFDFGRNGNLAIGSIINYRSGEGWSRLGRVGYSDDPLGVYLNNQGTYVYYADGRGNNRFSGFWHADLSARYQVQAWKDLNAWVKLDIANVLNNDEMISFRTSGSVDPEHAYTWSPSEATFGIVTSSDNFQEPRSYLFSVGLQY